MYCEKLSNGKVRYIQTSFCIYFALILPFCVRTAATTRYSSALQNKYYKTIIFINGFIIMLEYCQKWLKISISVKMTCSLKTNFGFYFALFLPLLSVHHDCDMFARRNENIAFTEQIRAISVIYSIQAFKVVCEHKINTDIAACTPFVYLVRSSELF